MYDWTQHSLHCAVLCCSTLCGALLCYATLFYAAGEWMLIHGVGSGTHNNVIYNNVIYNTLRYTHTCFPYNIILMFKHITIHIYLPHIVHSALSVLVTKRPIYI
eukprot:COSAG06_NODE_6155_length_3080_cov_113.120724_5_plen_103_part_01